MKIFLRIILILIGIFSVSAFAQETEDILNQLRFTVDLAGFKDLTDEGKIYQEIYLAFPNGQLSYISKGNKFIAGTKIEVSIKDLEDKQIAQNSWESISEVDSLAQAFQQVALEITGFLLTPGKYNLDIKITDLNSKAFGYAAHPVTVLKLSGDKLEISEIEFAQSVKRAKNTNKFVKNNIEVLPNPRRLYGMESPFLYFYAELYNLGTSKYTKEFSIVDIQGNIVEFSEKEYQAKSDNTIWVEKVNLLKCSSGKYALRLKFINQENGDVAFRESGFWFNNPHKVASTVQMDDQAIEDFRGQIYHLVDSKELKKYDQLNNTGKIGYINKFWSERTPQFRKEHLERFYTAQKVYGSKRTAGWESDQGRVFIMYGAPDDMDRNPASINSRAYEIWIYESLPQQGQVVFIFADLAIFGNYQLIHSTVKSTDRMEVFDPYWQERILIAR